jgi:hypothetical protein
MGFNLTVILLVSILAFIVDISINVRRVNINLDRLIKKITEIKGL